MVKTSIKMNVSSVYSGDATVRRLLVLLSKKIPMLAHLDLGNGSLTSWLFIVIKSEIKEFHVDKLPDPNFIFNPSINIFQLEHLTSESSSTRIGENF